MTEIWDMQYKTKTLFKILMFIQKRFICRNSTRLAKLEILENSWSKLLGSINDVNATVLSKKVGDIVY